MIDKIKSVVVSILLIIIQVSIINTGLIFGVYPNLILMFIVFITLRKGTKKGLEFALILGLLLDSLISSNFGIKALNYMFIVLILGSISNYVFEENIWVVLFNSLAASILYQLFSSVVYFFLSYQINLSNLYYEIFSPNTVSNVLVLAGFYALKYLFENDEIDRIEEIEEI